jgi:hypothetical protein
MDLSPYVESLRHDLVRAAEAGGEDTRQLAERLTAALEPSVRLALLDALSAAADEITRELAPGSVEVRLRSGEPEFVVAAPAVPDEPSEPADDRMPSALADADDAATARINVRLPEPLKARIEQAAARERQSVNAWLVRAAAAAVDDSGAGRRRRRSGGPGDSYTGWVR